VAAYSSFCCGRRWRRIRLIGLGYGSQRRAREWLRKVSSDFAAALEQVRQEMGKVIETPFGATPLRYFMPFEPVNIGHHDQMAYIQPFLADTQNHFAPL
jgi:hypothetical protein